MFNALVGVLTQSTHALYAVMPIPVLHQDTLHKPIYCMSFTLLCSTRQKKTCHRKGFSLSNCQHNCTI